MTAPLTYICPFCDREARVGKPCPGCEKKRKPAKKKKPAKKSWEQAKTSDGLDLPDGDFDYDDFVAREFGKAPHRKTGLKWYWWLLGVAALAAMIGGLITGWR